MPSAAHQTSPRAVQTPPGALPAPSSVAVLALTVPDAAGAAAWAGIAGLRLRVIDAWAVKTVGVGGAGTTFQVRTSAGGAITNAMDLNVAANALVRALSLDDASQDLTVGTGLQVNVADGGDANGIMYVKVALINT